jgi:hypothetical protein
MADPVPTQLLSARDVARLSGFHKNTILKQFSDPRSVLGEDVRVVLGEYRVPVANYERWISCPLRKRRPA